MAAFYAVARGVKPGIYQTWDACKGNVIGFKGAVYKKFPTLSQAKDFVNGKSKHKSTGEMDEGLKLNKKQARLGLTSEFDHSDSESHDRGKLALAAEYKSSTVNDQVIQSYEQDIPYLKADVSNFYQDPSQYWIKGVIPCQLIKIYVDGASRGNSRTTLTASGYGVFYGLNDSRNAAVGIHAVDNINVLKPTNQRAELFAIKHALVNIANELHDFESLNNGESLLTKKYTIYSDSQYAQKSLSIWLPAWFRNGWKNSQGKQVLNRDIIESSLLILNYINHVYDRFKLGSLEFRHVKGHRGDQGNEWADKLANIGADTMQRTLQM